MQSLISGMADFQEEFVPINQRAQNVRGLLLYRRCPSSSNIVQQDVVTLERHFLAAPDFFRQNPALGLAKQMLLHRPGNQRNPQQEAGQTAVQKRESLLQ